MKKIVEKLNKEDRFKHAAVILSILIPIVILAILTIIKQS